MKKIAFTLAEVLITLAIIGIVAAMVIPSLNNNIKNAQLVTALKKDYSTLSQATQMIVADNGGSIKGLCANNDCLRDLYGQYVKDIKSCNGGSSLGVCWHLNSGSNIAHHLNGALPSWDSSLSVGVDLSGGFLRFGWNSQDCSSSTFSTSGQKLNSNIACGFIVVDVNGYVKPNVIGRDIYYLAILENRILPLGTNMDNFACSTSSQGYGCAAKVLTEGAINY